MIETIEVKINNKTYKYSKGITVQEILTEHQQNYKYPVILARINNRLRELSENLEEDSKIEFLDLTSSEGNRSHINGLILVLLYAIRTLYGKKATIRVEHSLDKGLYVKTGFKLTEDKLNSIKLIMSEIVKKDLPINKLNIDRIEAINYYKEIGDETKSGVLKYITDNYVTLYRLGNVYDYFFSLMPTATGGLEDFDLTYIDDSSFVLRFPTVYINDKIKKYQHHPHMFEVFREYKDWANLIGIKDSIDLNRVVSTGKISDLIKIDETLQSNRLLNVAKEIYSKRKKVKIVLMAGPSSSGKTTTSRKLCMYLKSFGLQPKTIGMDDYFVERTETPQDENGNPDFECLEAVDLKLFDKQMLQLLNGDKVKIPTYNFALGTKEYHDEMKLEDNDILIIEGIHALDTKVLTNIPRDRKFKIYISPLTELNLDSHNRIPTTDNRLLRRIVRDNRTRARDVGKTIEEWNNVRSGEKKYIYPFINNIDYILNTSLVYEIGVLKVFVEPLLYSVKSDSPSYNEARRLIGNLKIFFPIPSDYVNEDSILREFIGKSAFNSI